ncbi:uncharacterized protein METZ01_LOCUS439621, partial [marine metagenome]
CRPISTCVAWYSGTVSARLWGATSCSGTATFPAAICSLCTTTSGTPKRARTSSIARCSSSCPTSGVR